MVESSKQELFSYCINILLNITVLKTRTMLFATQITMSNLDGKTWQERAFKILHYFYTKPQQAHVFVRIPRLCNLNGKANTTPQPFWKAATMAAFQIKAPLVSFF